MVTPGVHQRTLAAIVGFFLVDSATQAGLYSTLDPVNPLPAKWRGYLPDQRLLRLAAVDPSTAANIAPSSWRERMRDRVLTLDGRTKSAEDAVNLSFAMIRLGHTEQALGFLRTARRQWPDDFRLAAHQGTASQLAGDLDLAVVALRDAVRLAGPAHRGAESLHLKLVESRLKEGRKPADAPDAILDLGRLTKDDLARLQQLGLALPADGRLLWLMGEAALATGDIRTAANMLDGCAGEFGMASPKLRARRQELRRMVEALDAKDDHTVKISMAFASTRPLGRVFDAAKMPMIRADRPNLLPFEAIAETTVDKGFRPRFVEYVNSLDGKPVTLVGYAAKSGDDSDGRAFLMTEHPIGCWFCESPEPMSIVKVELAKAVDPAAIGKGFLKIRGTLALNRTDPERFLFEIRDGVLVPTD
jgi:hypothetical protein